MSSVENTEIEYSGKFLVIDKEDKKIGVWVRGENVSLQEVGWGGVISISLDNFNELVEKVNKIQKSLEVIK